MRITGFPFIALVLVLGPRPSAAQPRQPIRVGSNVQESKLVERVMPLYPAEAKAAGIRGEVILQATVDEAGQVADVKVLRGQPMLDQAAMDAVRQWRYNPTLLNGQPVAVIATVTIVFPNPVYVGIDGEGYLTESGSEATDPPLDERIRAAWRVVVDPAADVPLPTLARALERLRKQGVADIQLRRGFVYFEGALFYDSATYDVRPPEVALDEERLRSLARRELEEKGMRAAGSFRYQLFVNEVGEVVGIRSTGALKLGAVEDELRRSRVVVTPGRRGADPVPTMITVLISVE